MIFFSLPHKYMKSGFLSYYPFKTLCNRGLPCKMSEREEEKEECYQREGERKEEREKRKRESSKTMNERKSGRERERESKSRGALLECPWSVSTV